MAKSSKPQGATNRAGTKGRGRTNITQLDPRSPSKPHVQQEREREVTRPVTAGNGKHRGDRRDTSRLYTTNRKHAARGSNPRPDVKTRKR